MVTSDADDPIELVGKRLSDGSYVTGSATLVEYGNGVEVACQKHANPPVAYAEI